jgi:Zn ribbon nucleic-acid-binding protein
MKRVRRFFQKITKCPNCEGIGHQHVGTSTGGGMQYRRCKHCGETYRVLPSAVEEQLNPNQPSSIRML